MTPPAQDKQTRKLRKISDAGSPTRNAEVPQLSVLVNFLPCSIFYAEKSFLIGCLRQDALTSLPQAGPQILTERSDHTYQIILASAINVLEDDRTRIAHLSSIG